MGIHNAISPSACAAFLYLLDQYLLRGVIIGIPVGNVLERWAHVVVPHLMAGEAIAILHPVPSQVVIASLLGRRGLGRKFIKIRNYGGRNIWLENHRGIRPGQP